jgi:chromosome segregation ATPase
VGGGGSGGSGGSGGGDSSGDSRRDHLTNEITSTQQEIAAIDRTMSEKQAALSLLKEEQKGVREKKMEGHRVVTVLPGEVRRRLDSKKREREVVQRRLDRSTQAEQAARRGVWVRAVEAYMGGMVAGLGWGEGLLSAQVRVAAAAHCCGVLSDALAAAAEGVAEAKAGLEGYVRRVGAAEGRLAKCKAEYQNADARLTQKKTEMGKDALGRLYKSACEAFPPMDEGFLGHLEERMEDLKGAIDGSVDNPEVLVREAQVRHHAEATLGEINTAEGQLAHHAASCQERLSEWVENVRNVGHKLNTHFGEGMGGLRYTGEVHLVQNGLICDYEVRLMVSFRRESGMVELTGTRQSGGERAVSTVMYLMALQRMTRAPFRVVDEVNQGEWG